MKGHPGYLVCTYQEGRLAETQDSIFIELTARGYAANVGDSF
jgi:hypothetical protein